MLRDRAERGQKSLSVARRLDSLHTPLALTRGPVRVLTAVVEISALAVLHTRQELAFGRAVTDNAMVRLTC